MKRSLVLVTFFVVFAAPILLFGQTAYTTSGAGTVWSDPLSWTPNIVGGPSITDGTITVSHNLTVDVNVIVDQMTIGGGVTLTVNPSITLSVGGVTTSAVTDLTVNGSLVLQGSVTMITAPPPPPPPKQGVMQVNGLVQVLEGGAVNGSTTTSVKFNAGSVYDHVYTVGSGTIPTATWDITSICQVTGTPGGVPSGISGQTFGTFTWNTPGSFTFYDLNGTLTDVNGDLNLTASPGYLYLTFSTGFTLNVDGNFTINTEVAFTDAADVTINVLGNVVISNGFTFLTGANNITMDIDGSLTISGGSHDFTYSTGNTNINLAGDLALTGGTIGKSGSGVQTITFDGSSTQNFTGGSTVSNSMNYIVNNFAILDLGTSALEGGGDLTLISGSTLLVGSLDVSGAMQNGTTAGNIRVGGTRVYNSGSNIIYDGVGAQVIGNGFPAVAAVNLEIDNASGVTNSAGVSSIIGDLTLTNGSFIIGASSSLDVQSNFNVASGSIGGSSTSNLTFSGSGSMGSLVMTSGSENLNNLTLSRSGDVVLASDLTISGTLSLTGNLDFSSAGTSTLTINGSMSGGGGLKSNNNSNLVIGGTGVFGVINYAGSGNQLNNLTLARTSSGTYTWSSAVTVNNAVNLDFGTLTHSSGLTMAGNSTFFKGQGSITTNSPVAVSSYNVEYIASGNTGLEIPPLSTALNDLTVNAGGTVTLQNDVTINGDFILTSGTLDASTNDVTMAGATSNWSANGGAYTINSANSTIISGITTMGGSSIDGTQFGNLTINGSATLNAPSDNINISGTFSNSGTFNAGTGSVTFNGTGQTLNSSGTSFNDVVISGTVTLGDALDVNDDLLISSTLDVSTSNHSVTVGGIWSNLGTLTHRSGTVIFDGTNQTISSNAKPFYNVTVAGSGTTLLSDAMDLNGALTINSGSTLSVGVSNHNITLDGDWSNSGSFTAGAADVIFNGSDVQDIDGSTVTSFNNIDIGNTSTLGVRVESDQNLTGTLTITTASSKFDADGTANTSIFTLVSADDDPATDGNIAALTTPANFTGDVTVQRYMSSEGGIWRYLTSPVSGLTVADWQGEFPITGNFTGADDLGGANLPSLYTYDETHTDIADSGWVAYPVTTNTESITPGIGYSTFIRAAAGQTTVDQRGPINSGNFNFSVSFTTGPGASDDGWNLLGNPYPSALDWDALWNDGSTASINSTSYVKDNGGGGGVFATFNASTGTGTNGGTKNIAQGQSFWVQANNSGTPTLIAAESMKTTDTHEFFRITPPVNYLRIALNDGVNSDETLIHFFDDAEPMGDKYDAYKLKNDLFNLSTLTSDSKDMVINALKTIDCESNLSLNITNIDEGNYSLNFTELNSFTEAIELYLVDNFVGENIKIVNEQIYDFEVTADEASYGSDRFTILFSEPSINTELIVQGSDVCDSQNAVVSIEASEIDVTYVLFKDGVQISDPATGNGSTLELALTNLGNVNGEYEIDVKGDSGCGSVSITNKAIVTLEGLYTVDQVEGDQSCSPASLTVSATGAPVDGAYRWYETEISTTLLAETSVGEYMTPVLNNSTTYFVSIVNSLGCEGERSVVEAVIINLEIPIVELDTLEHGVYQLVSSAAQGNQWFLNGVALSGATANTLVITEPGTYSVTVEQNGCMVDSDDYDYNDLVTGLSDELNDVLVSIAPNPFTDSFELHIPGERFNLKKTEITIFDINGKIVYLNKKVKSEIISIALREIKNGIYLINIYDGETGVQHKLVKE